MTVQTQTDKRFRRVWYPARRIRASTRRWWRVARTVTVMVGMVIGGYQLVELVLAAPFLVVREIVVRGNDQLSEGEVLAFMSGLRGENILTLDLDAHRRRLVTSRWLRAGTLRRILPSTVEILVDERRPVALARFDGLLYLIDERGTVLDLHGPRFAEFDMPIIDGLGWPETSGTVVDPVRMELLIRLLERLKTAPEVFGEVSQIDVTNPYDAVVLLNDDPALLHLGSDMFLERLRSYAELAPALRARVADIDYVDLRFDQRVFVKSLVEQGTATGGRDHQRALASGR
jgi:cell division septal protein FtsQ